MHPIFEPYDLDIFLFLKPISSIMSRSENLWTACFILHADPEEECPQRRFDPLFYRVVLFDQRVQENLYLCLHRGKYNPAFDLRHEESYN